MLAQLEPVITWVHQNPHFAGLFVFAVSFLEAVVVIGSLIPGTLLMTAIGGLIGLGVIPMQATLVWAIVGAILGDGFSFWLGFHYHEHVRDFWPFSRYPKLLAKGESFFSAHGGKSIFLARFFGPVRAFVPVIAGMLHMRVDRYVFANVSSAVLWAPVYLLPGFLLGAVSKVLPPALAWRLLMYVLLVLLLLWSTMWLIHILAGNVTAQLGRLFTFVDRKLAHIKSLQVVYRFALYDAEAMNGSRQLAMLLLLVMTLTLLAILAVSVSHHGVLTHANQPVWHLMRGLRAGYLDPFFLTITYLGEKKVLSFMWLAVFSWFLWRRQWHLAMHWLIVLALSAGGMLVLKQWFHIFRPAGLVHTPVGYSFPSGHATLSTALYVFLAVLISQNIHTKGVRARLYGVVTVIVVAVCLSRLYLGAHWLTDVIGGVLLGLACVAATTMLLRHEIIDAYQPHILLSVALLSLLGTWFVYEEMHYSKDKISARPVVVTRVLDANRWWQNVGTSKPYHRLTFTGRPLQLLNVQWAGDLGDIIDQLSKQGWMQMDRHSLGNILARFASVGHDNYLPLFQQLYHDHRPILLMYKPLIPDEHGSVVWIVLRLWDASLRLAPGNVPLWLGTVSIAKPKRYHIFHRHKHGVASVSLKPATSLLIKDLSGFQWRLVDVVKRWQLKSARYQHQDVLLVRAVS